MKKKVIGVLALLLVATTLWAYTTRYQAWCQNHGYGQVRYSWDDAQCDIDAHLSRSYRCHGSTGINWW